MTNQNTLYDAQTQSRSAEGQQLKDDVLQAGTPVLANANDLQYRAYKRSYLNEPGNDVLIIVACGWYYPTPKVNLYFEQVYGKFEYKLMQNNSSAGFYLATYHTADYCSGAAPLGLPSTIIVEDAHGRHSVPVEFI